jgi:hypothetical protein
MGSGPAYSIDPTSRWSGAHGLTSENPLSTLFRNGCKVAVSSANITASPLAARAAARNAANWCPVADFSGHQMSPSGVECIANHPRLAGVENCF